MIRGDESRHRTNPVGSPTVTQKSRPRPKARSMTEYWWILLFRILTGLSQYPVFKVQAQRRITLSVVRAAVNPLLPGPSVPISGPARAVPRRRRMPPLFAEASGKSHGDHRKMAPALPDRLLELAVYQAGTPFPEGTRHKRPAYVTTGSDPMQEPCPSLVWRVLIPT